MNEFDFKALSVALLHLADEGNSGNTPFCGALERSIRKLDEPPKLVRPWNSQKARERGQKHEEQHQRIVMFLIDTFGLSEEVESRVNERHAVYLKDAEVLKQPAPTREERYPTAREWVINGYIMDLSPNVL